MPDQITIDQFSQVEIKVGKVVAAEDVAESRKLIKLTVDVGEGKMRTVFTGVRGFGYKGADFEGKQFLFVTNLEPKKIMNQESQGMILAVDGPDKPLFVSAEGLPVGARVR
jgi:methionyl-tRNA synthetase